MTDAINPFGHPTAVSNSNYSSFEAGRLVHPDTGTEPSPLTSFVHDGVRALVLNDQFPCVGGKAAFRQGGYRFGLYSDLGSPDAAAGLARDLFSFTRDLASIDGSFCSYVASFEGPLRADELAFEEDLWKMLQRLHDLDAQYHEWDPVVSDDPGDARFSFSFAGVALFVIGLHAASSRAARRFAWPTLVFNPHRQFDELREHGRFVRFQEIIRRGETRLQGDTNPMLADYGRESEAKQYSGRRVDGAWACPFHPRVQDEPTTD
jgi:FPC/CPF motif-containing protein YcgG